MIAEEMTETELEARIDELGDEIDQLRACAEIEHRIREGFVEVEHGEDGEVRFYPAGDAALLMPLCWV